MYNLYFSTCSGSGLVVVVAGALALAKRTAEHYG